MTNEKILKPLSGGVMLIITILAYIAGPALMIGGIVSAALAYEANLEVNELLTVLMIVGGIALILVAVFLSIGIRIVKPNEALVLLYFGKYYGTIKTDGLFWVNPFARPFSPKADDLPLPLPEGQVFQLARRARISLKAEAYNNNQQKVHDLVGNPIEIGVVLIWRVVDTFKACFDVNNYAEYISTQADAATRQVVRLFPFDTENDDEKSLRGSSQEVSDLLRSDLQERVDVAGVEILEVRISHLAYAKEIAAIMLQRQQAAAVVAAKQKIADGAVGIVETTLSKLEENNIVKLSAEKRQEIVSNLLVILCSSREAQPTLSISTNEG